MERGTMVPRHIHRHQNESEERDKRNTAERGIDRGGRRTSH